MNSRSRFFALLFYTTLSCVVFSFVHPEKPTVLKVDFEKSILGVYDDAALKNDFDTLKWMITADRGHIIEDENKGQVLRVAFPKGGVGPQQSGFQFVRPIPESEEYYLSYDIKFEEGFDFKKGGKIPGLTSGGAKFTGGVNPDNGEGWSARYMWVGNKPIIYLYYVDMLHKYGESMTLNATIGTGKWHNFTQHIKLNKGDQKDALIEVWIDGNKVGTKKNFRLRIGKQGLIDTFYFSTFHGGGTPDWAPDNDSFIQVDNIVVSATNPRL